ncbi:uncharacterized protein DUF955 [Branchiibius hedensis]|uniref:IrrE N-terminal-like domain-containing protein n=1 Tax=Branchiibius hedensis TaxID=672460 RepID=A0A2Y9BSR1_9MICO|nr:ImmA/IrrE family metallo-endopeptidase [Branchiibius hedensis]PWJ22817.1 uncharacterized protein DUF955 [Branchiibius hedensis]PWJ23934.1 uncharacterized protein DUF955 [Branchiibius hedensis]SSA32752.1 protein of unknown function [Branchiibius hedensis]SSA59166.1 protein of unknown function [Branchiibius hedensis]
MTDWQVVFCEFPDGVLGSTDCEARTIYLQRGLTQAQRRSTLAHELAHAVDPSSLEHCVDQAAVRQLIPLQRLADALAWSQDEYELARELWVDVPTVRVRLEGLTEDERDEIERRVAALDG